MDETSYSPVKVKAQTVEVSGNGMVTLKNAALYLGISENTLRWWINYEKVPFDYYKIGGRIKFYKSDLDEYVNQQQVPTKGAH